MPPMLELRRFFEYNPRTGRIRRIRDEEGKLMRRPKAITKGTKNGCHYVRYLGKPYMAHRFIVRWMTGIDPRQKSWHIFHANGNKLDNRFFNLRLAKGRATQEGEQTLDALVIPLPLEDPNDY